MDEEILTNYTCVLFVLTSSIVNMYTRLKLYRYHKLFQRILGIKNTFVKTTNVIRKINIFLELQTPISLNER